MQTPIIMLILLVAPYLALLVVSRLRPSARIKPLDVAPIGLALVFVFTGIGHFTRTELMSHMLPPWAPFREMLIYCTGVLEFAVAASLLVPKLRYLAGWFVIGMLALFLPANIYSAISRVEMGGHAWGPLYLLIRIPLQLILASWAYWLVVRKSSPGWPGHLSGFH